MRRLVSLLAVVLLATGCRSEGADSGDAETALLEQRDQVAGTATTLVDSVRDQIDEVEVVETQGGWEGCTSIFPEGYADFQYVARVQLKAPGAPERLSAQLASVVEESGLEVTGTSADDVVVRDGDVTARLWDLPPVNTDGDLTIQLAAHPCVDVPRSEWEDWMRRDDPGPKLGG